MSDATPPPNPQAGLIRVLPHGYIGKRQPEYWTLAQLVANMSATLSTLSYHNFNTKKTERARVILGMVCEYVEGNLIVKAFYDWDVPAPPNMTPLTEINSQEELDAEEAKLKENQAEQLVEFKRAMALAHPDVHPENFAFAGRSGWKAKKKTASWVISLRCFVQGRSMYISDILTHIKAIFESNGVKMFPQLDGSVYKITEQCLAIVGGHKETNDKRVLVPLTHTDQLEAFIIQDVENCTLMSPARPAAVPSSIASSSASAAPPKRARVEAADAPLVSKMSRKVPRRSLGLGGNSAILNYLQTQFKVDSNLIHLDKVTMFPISAGTGSTQATGFTIPTTCRLCPFLKREHNSNHVYFTVGLRPGAERLNCSRVVNVVLKCHDSECSHNARGTDRTLMPADVENAFRHIALAGTEEDILELNSHSEITDTGITDGMKKGAVLQVLEKLQIEYPEMDCSITDESDVLQPTTLGNGDGFVTLLKNNRWCPLHKKEHDSWMNCVWWFTEAKQQLICRQDVTHQLDYSADKTQINIIFNVNVTNNASDAVEIRDFGSYTDFPTIHQDTSLNQLCFNSLKGYTRDVAYYAVQMMKGRFIFQYKTWYRFTGKYWKVTAGPDQLLTGELIATYETLKIKFPGERQTRWIHNLISDLSTMNKRKGFIEDMERLTMDEEVIPPLAQNPHLISFQNGTFDARDCSFREHRAEDYLTELLSYDLPTETDAEIKQEIDHFMEGIMPNESVRTFLWIMMAIHLAGKNEKSVAMIWTGTGGNGKSVLKHLMSLAFEVLHSEPSATFLTSERPSPEKPAPNLVKLRNCRSVFASEPEAGKRINTGFLKFITGDDIVECRNCHGNDILQFYPRFLVTLLCNAVPLFQGGADEVKGLWRRLHIISFEQEFVADPKLPHQRKEDSTLKKRMERWPPHFMKMLIDVFTKYVRGGKQLSIPPQVTRNLEEQKEENSPFDRWLEENLVKANEPHRIHFHRVKRAFEREQEQQNGSRSSYTPTNPVIRQKVTALGFVVVCGQKTRMKDARCNVCRSGVDNYVKDAALREDVEAETQL